MIERLYLRHHPMLSPEEQIGFNEHDPDGPGPAIRRAIERRAEQLAAEDPEATVITHTLRFKFHYDGDSTIDVRDPSANGVANTPLWENAAIAKALSRTATIIEFQPKPAHPTQQEKGVTA